MGIIEQLKQKILSSSISSRMANGMFWSFTGTALAKFLTLVAGIVCAHILSKNAYGEFSMVRSTINMFIVLGSAGLGVTSTKYISEYKANKKEKIPAVYAVTNYFGVFTGVLTAILIICMSTYLADNVLRQPSLSGTFKIGAILLFFTILNGVQNGALIGFENFRAVAINTLLGSIFESLFMLIGAYYMGVDGATLGLGVGFVVIFLANHFSINKQFILNNLVKLKIKQLAWRDCKVLYTYSLPAALSSLLIAPSFWAIRSILVRCDGFQELATFEAADQWKVIILFIPTAISQIVLPLLSSLQIEGDKFVKTLKYNLIIIGMSSMFIAVLVVFMGEPIMMLYGSKYADYMPIRILALSTVFSALANVLEMALYSLGKMWQSFVINLVWAVSMIGSAFYFSFHSYGASGLSLSVLISYIISLSIFAVYSFHVIRKRILE